jgi:hypothetical protein
VRGVQLLLRGICQGPGLSVVEQDSLDDCPKQLSPGSVIQSLRSRRNTTTASNTAQSYATQQTASNNSKCNTIQYNTTAQNHTTHQHNTTTNDPAPQHNVMQQQHISTTAMQYLAAQSYATQQQHQIQ